MKQIILDVPDNKWNFIMELVKSLGFIKFHEKDTEINSAQVFDIPDEHKKIVRERIRTAKEDDFVKWDTIKKQYNLD